MKKLIRQLPAVALITAVAALSMPAAATVSISEGAANASFDSPPVGRLPDLARPRAYRLDLILDPREEGFSGEVEIDITLARPSAVIWIHGLGLEVAAASALDAGGRSWPASYEQVLDSGVAALRFEEPLPPGALTLRIAYSARYDTNLAGLFKVEEQGDAYVLAKSESIQARRYLPGFDEPGLKASYDMRITVPTGNHVITNSPETGREPAGEGMQTISFARTRPMPTYLLSLAVGPFDVVERAPLPPNAVRKRPIPLRGFARRGRAAEMAYILDITPQMMEIFETQLRREYPFQKLDIIAAPQWPSGATELSAAITYREQRILLGPNPAPGARLALVNVHAHELAHMWFGNLVTPPWWDDLWLKEGFATWGTPLALTLMEPDAGHEVSAAASAIAAMELDSLASTRAIREPIDDNHSVRNAYDAITYRKSLGVIHMVDQYFGAEVFRPALGRYVEAFAEGSADSPQFYDIIGRETNTPELAETFRSFVEQKGVPLVEAQLHCSGGESTVTLEQSRYRPLGSPIAAADSRWHIPLCLRTAAEQRHCVMLSQPRQVVSLGSGECPAWILPNDDGAGYYRWNVPPQQWQALLQDFERLSPTEALSLVDSAFAAFSAGKLQPELVWQVVAASSQSAQRQVVTAALPHLQRYSERYFTAAQREALGRRLQDWYQPVLERVEGSDDPEAQLLHARLLSFMALVARQPAARQTLQQQALAFTGFGGVRKPEALSSDLYDAALTVAVQDEGAPFMQHLIEVRAQLDDPRFDSASARALGRVVDEKQLPLIRALALGPDMGAREAFELLRAATTTPATRDANWRWVVDNFPAITAKIPAQWRRRTPSFAAGFCSDRGARELAELFQRYGELTPGYQRSYDQSAEGIALCMALKEQAQLLADTL